MKTLILKRQVDANCFRCLVEIIVPLPLFFCLFSQGLSAVALSANAPRFQTDFNYTDVCIFVHTQPWYISKISLHNRAITLPSDEIPKAFGI